VHALWDQLLVISTLFRSRWGASGPDLSMPLFPSLRGAVVTKAAMTETIRQAARHLQCPLSSPDGMSRISGHSLRPTGAQGLSKMGLDIWSIELLGRWGSKTVQQYVRDAAVSTAAARARSLTMQAAMAELATESSPARGPGSIETGSLESLRDAVARLAPDALAPFRVSLIAEVQDALQRHLAVLQAGPVRAPRSVASSSSSSSSSSSEASQPASASSDHLPCAADRPDLFKEEVSSVWKRAQKRHIVAVGPADAPADKWVTICGWHFGKSGNSLPPEAAHPLCAKCRQAAVVGIRGLVLTKAPAAGRPPHAFPRTDTRGACMQ